MITKHNLERLVKNYKHDPEKIGIAILKMLGYEVRTYHYSNACYVLDKAGKIVFAYNGVD